MNALPLEFGSKLRILRTVFIPAALHGAEASLVSEWNICTVFVGSVELSFVLAGLVICLLLILELSFLCLVGRWALTLPFTLSGVGSA